MVENCLVAFTTRAVSRRANSTTLCPLGDLLPEEDQEEEQKEEQEQEEEEREQEFEQERGLEIRFKCQE